MKIESHDLTPRMRRVGFLVLAVAVAVFVALGAGAGAQGWPHWRGPGRDGRAAATEAMPAGPFHLELGWKRRLGLGYSSISVAGTRAVTLFTDKPSDFVIALDTETGKELWRYRLGEAYPPMEGGSAGGPTSTPTIDNAIVYALAPRGELVALRLDDGRRIWSRAIDQQDGAVRPFYGFTTSPTVIDDLLIVQTGGPGGHSISAFDKRTGALRWSRLDAGVEYESPLVMTIDGVRQLVALNGSEVVGLRPETGELLWQTPHGAKSDQGQFSQPVPVSDRRFLVTARESGSSLFEVVRDAAGGFAVSRLWNAPVFRRSYAIPVAHDGRLYGFNGSFMSAVDAASGKELWRSRPPGGQGLAAAGKHLVVFNPDGDLVVVEADPQGYKEAARLNVSDSASQATPALANGQIFVRNLDEIAMVRVRVGAATTTSTDRGAVDDIPGRFTDFVRALHSASDKSARIDAFLAAQKQIPILEGSDVAHFVYRGPATDVALNGSMTDIFPLYSSVPLRRVSGTDFFYRSFRLPADARWDYQFVLNFESFALDPLNPLRVPERRGRGELSELRMPGWLPPLHLRPPPTDRPRGRLEEFAIDSKVLGGTRRARVWLPPGYESAPAPLSLMVVISPEHRPLTLAWMDRSLDNLVGTAVAPLVTAFVEIREISEEAGDPAPKIAQAIAEEFLPALIARYRLSPAAADHAIAGAFRSALLPIYTALKFPGTFGKVAMQSITLGTPFAEQTSALIRTHQAVPLAIYVDWNKWELRSAELKTDMRDEGMQVVQLLKDRGYAVAGGEATEGSGWASWRNRTDRYLRQFFPLVTAQAEVSPNRSPSLLRTALIVADADRSIAFYRLLGFAPESDVTNARVPAGNPFPLNSPATATRLVILRSANAGDAGKIGLVQFTAPPPQPARADTTRVGLGDMVFVFDVADADAVHAALQRAGARILESPQTYTSRSVAADGRRLQGKVFHAYDPDGYLVELLQAAR